MISATRSAVHRLLVRTHLPASRAGRKAWFRAWYLLSATGPGYVRTELFGRRLLVPTGDKRPITLRDHPGLFQPLEDAVAEAYRRNGRPVHIVDVGAAVGDTAAMLLEHSPEKVGTIYCVEGHPPFFDLLRKNLGSDDRCKLIQAVLSDHVGLIPSLTATGHGGTAAALGSDTTAAVTLDDLVSDLGPVDVLKTDADGFDGRVLQGAEALLRIEHPVVAFEWSPGQIADVGAESLQPFEILDNLGYSTYRFYSKIGAFERSMEGLDEHLLRELNEACLRSGDEELYFDVVAV